MLLESILKVCVFCIFVNLACGDLAHRANHNFSAESTYALIPCINSKDCEDVNGTCIRNFCNCNNSHSCKLNSHILANKLGESCRSTEDCNMDFAVCDVNRKCSCGDGYIPSQNERKCLKTASGLGGSCEESVQCYTRVASTGCHENKCVCQQHMHEYNGSCYKNVDLGGPCQLFEECSQIPHAVCHQFVCQCSENYVSNGSVCLLKANGINFTCSQDIQCQAQLSNGAECSNGVCRCKDVFHFKTVTNQCVHDILLNENCGKHSDCHQPGTGPSRLECVLGVCKCKSPYLEESGFCISSSTSVVLFKSVMLFLGTLFLIK